MFIRLGRLAFHRRRLILALSVLFLLGAGAGGSRAFGSLSEGGFDDPRSESSRAAEFLEQDLQAGDPELVLVVDALGGLVDDPGVVTAAGDLSRALAAEDHVAKVASYWSRGQARSLRDRTGDSALVLVDLEGTEEEVNDAATEVKERYAGERGAVTVGMGCRTAVSNAVREQVESDLARAEAIAIPATLVLLVLVFGGLVACRWLWHCSPWSGRCCRFSSSPR